MKPKEFDELIRQKFDQNDFAYNARNWDRLEEQMDGRAKKRSVMVWWLMPLAGVAASVALAIGVSNLLRQPAGTDGANETYAHVYRTEPQPQQAIQPATEQDEVTASTTIQYPKPAIRDRKLAAKPVVTANGTDGFAIRYQNAVLNTKAPASNTHTRIDLVNMTAGTGYVQKDKKKQQPALLTEEYETFKPEDEVVRKPSTLSVILTGGINQGNTNSGYAAGAAIRKMVSPKVYVEGEVAYVSSNNKQSYFEAPAVAGPSGAAAKPSGAKMTDGSSKNTDVAADQGGMITKSYNINYAVVSPSLGVKIARNMSIGVGPDFQQMLADNRPAGSATDKNNQKTDPLFDVGFIGKTEISVTRVLKAGVSYRKGINNILTPMGTYNDREYLQFQLKCAILNK